MYLLRTRQLDGVRKMAKPSKCRLLIVDNDAAAVCPYKNHLESIGFMTDIALNTIDMLMCLNH